MNTEADKARKRAYYLAHREKLLAKGKKYRETHREERSIYGKLYRKVHKEQIRVNAKKYREEHREEIKLYHRKNKKRKKIRDMKIYYDLSVDEYNEMLRIQNDRCAICGKKMLGRFCHIDHCHKTGKVRGLLCHHCNAGIGNLFDDIAILEKAIKYLK